MLLLLEDGTVWAIPGNLGESRMGIDIRNNQKPKECFFQIKGINDVTDIAMAEGFTAYLKNDGTVFILTGDETSKTTYGYAPRKILE